MRSGGSGTPSNPARPLDGPGSRGWGARASGHSFMGGKTTRRRPLAKEGDLFGTAPAASEGPIERRMAVVGETDKAWRLVPKDRPDLDPQWAPKSQVSRQPPPDDDVFVIPRWVARDRGWL